MAEDQEFDSTGWMASGLEVRPLPGSRGRGVFACRPFPRGERLAVYGGQALTYGALLLLPADAHCMSLQVDDDLFLVSFDPIDPADYVNHSCEANAGMSGPRALVALRDIGVDEEICYDYAMSDSSPINAFTCVCGSPLCRGEVSMDDWRLPELWQRYGEAFSPYLLRRIRRLRDEGHHEAVALQPVEA